MKPTNAGMSPWIRALLAGAGIFGLQPQDGVYAHQCAGAGVDLARYVQGWREGKWEFDSRMRKD